MPRRGEQPASSAGGGKLGPVSPEGGRRAGVAALIAVAAFALLSGLRQINDPDYWTHLALGRAFAEAGTIFLPEPFVGAPAAPDPAPAPLHERVASAYLGSEWPFQLGLYGTFAAGGHAAVSAFVALCAALAATLLAWPLAREADPARAALGALYCAAAIFVAHGRFSPRPEIVGAVLLAAALRTALAFGERPSWRPLVGLGAILALWAPVHVSWAVGAALAGLVLALRPRLDFWRAQPLPLRLAALAAAALVGLGAARFAWRVVEYLAPGGLLGGITEMQPTWRYPALFLQLALLSGAGAVLAWGGRSGRAARLALCLAAALLGAVVARNVGFAALAMIPGALEGIASWAPLGARAPRAVAPACALGVAALLALALLDRDPPFGAGVDWRWFPRDAAEFVRARPLLRPVFNSMDVGGYLDWAWNGRPRTFLDGRLADAATLADHDAVVHGAPAEPLSRRGISTALVQPMYSSGRLLQAIAWFLRSPRWRIVRATDALVFAAEPLPTGLEPIPPSEAWKAVLRAADVLEDQAERPPHLDFTRALALVQLGDRQAALEAFERGRQRFPRAAEQYRALGTALRGRSHPASP